MALSVRWASAEDLIAAERILRSLPDWFGIDEANDAYASDLRSMCTIVAINAGGDVVGCLALNSHNSSTVEIHVMGVAADHHRIGIGRALVDRAVEIATRNGYRMLEVKTLGPSHPDPYYVRTRRFYDAMGFLPVEEIHGLWPDNPCLVMVKVLEDYATSGEQHEPISENRRASDSGTSERG